MGNILPKVVWSDLNGDEDEPKADDVNTSSRNSRDVQLAQIRTMNLKTKTDKVQVLPNDNTILEEAVLEDLCEEAELELDETRIGPMSNHQKANLITQLSNSPKTKHHFTTESQFDDYVEKKIHGDKRMVNKLMVDQERAAQRMVSQHSNQHILMTQTSNKSCMSRRSKYSNRSRISRKSNVSNHNITNNDLTEQLKRHRSNISNASRNSTRKNWTQDLPSTTKELGTELGENKRWSKMTTYSLPSNFAANNYSAMNESDRQRTSIVCKTNDQTLQMATELLQKGKIIPKEEDNREKQFSCCIFVCTL